MKPILEIQNISKKFKIRHLPGGYLSLRERLSSLNFRTLSTEEFWALNDVTFDVQAGESIGIIGRNGAGKSTLLKILSRITPPSKGRIVTRGRIASLLEVGTGFHPELTGRENIFFNGSLLGMRQQEILGKFDEIVDFSGTEKFLDTPLKHFSSGMQLRLAFAVAAFLEPEILIIDEVLAVGDADFQKKCIGKMKDVSNSGRTILFVSHNLSLVKQLCNRSIWLNQGAIKLEADTNSVINSYLEQGNGNIARSGKAHHLGKGVKLERMDSDSNPAESLSDVTLRFELKTEDALTINSIGLFINNLREERVAIVDLRRDVYRVNRGRSISFRIDIHKISLIEGEYRLGLFMGSNLISGNFPDLMDLVILSKQRSNTVLNYDVEVRGKVELDYEFANETN